MVNVGVASHMYMQVHDSGQCQCKQDQHYTQAVSPSCNHLNGDGWPALSTGHRGAERVQPKTALARNVRSQVQYLQVIIANKRILAGTKSVLE